MRNMLIAIALLLFLLGIVAFIAAYRSRDKAGPVPRRDSFTDNMTNAPFGPDSLGPGAAVTYRAIDYVVRGTLTITQGPYIWYEHMLQGDNEQLWMTVDVDSGVLDITVWESRLGEPIEPTSRLTYQGIEYAETERGRATYRSEGTTGLPDAGEVRYVDYRSVDVTGTADAADVADDAGAAGVVRKMGAKERYLGLEEFDNAGTWEVSAGYKAAPSEFTIYSAPQDDES